MGSSVWLQGRQLLPHHSGGEGKRQSRVLQLLVTINQTLPNQPEYTRVQLAQGLHSCLHCADPREVFILRPALALHGRCKPPAQCSHGAGLFTGPRALLLAAWEQQPWEWEARLAGCCLALALHVHRPGLTLALISTRVILRPPWVRSQTSDQWYPKSHSRVNSSFHLLSY